MTSEKSPIADKLFNGLTSLCFIFAGVIWNNGSAQNTREHEEMMTAIKANSAQLSDHEIKFAVIEALGELENKKE